MDINMPKTVKSALALIKGISPSCITHKTMVELIQLILLLWREFLIKISIIPKIEHYKIKIEKGNKILYQEELKEIRDLRETIKKIIAENCVSKEQIDEDDK